MNLIRKSKTEATWSEEISYVESIYNISVSANGRCAIFNSATGAVIILDTQSLMNCAPSDKVCLVENGFLVPLGTLEYDDYISNVNISEKAKTDIFTIIPTTVCNARCFYCYEESYCKKTVNQNTVWDIVRFLNENLDDDSDCVLDWYGGEPLLCMNQIDMIISKLNQQGKLLNRWHSSITTNGTLLSKGIVTHLVQDWHLESAHITIDGTEKEHNRRKNLIANAECAFENTYKGIYELLSAGVYVNLRIHLDHDNKDSFADILEELSGLFCFDNLHLFPTYLFPPENKMPKNYIKDLEKEDLFFNVFKVLLKSGYKVSLKDMFPFPRHSGCFASRPNTLVIGPDGNAYACVQDFDNTNEFKDNKYSIYSNFKYALDTCNTCSYLPICLGGCLYNRNLDKSVRTPCVRNRYVVRPLLRLVLESYVCED